MIKCSSTLRVRYAEVDRTGAASPATCLDWFDLGRSELLKQAGLAYEELEGRGIALPVVEANCRRTERIGYDDLLRIETTLEVMSPSRLKFHSTISLEGEAGLIVAAEGFTINAVTCVDGGPASLPADVSAALGGGS